MRVLRPVREGYGLMRPDDIHFEDRLSAVEEKIADLRRVVEQAGLDIDDAMSVVDEAYESARAEAYQDLSPWQTVWMARHPQRPGGMEYVDALLEDCVELRTDRIEGDDPALASGLGWFEGEPVVYLAHRRGRSTRENLALNFGMMHPAGYRKALHVMELATKFGRPILSFIDTPAAHPGVHAETRGQAMAIAENLYHMADMPVPIVVVVVGQGGSGGALGVGVGDVLLMLQYAVYCVAPPEAFSGIIWKDAGEHAPEAAEGLKLTAEDLHRFDIVDEILQEPVGGAHRDPAEVYGTVRTAIRRHLSRLQRLPAAELIQRRYEKYRTLGVFEEVTVA